MRNKGCGDQPLRDKFYFVPPIAMFNPDGSYHQDFSEIWSISVPGDNKGTTYSDKIERQMYVIGVCLSISTDKSIGGYFVRCKCLTHSDMDQAQ